MQADGAPPIQSPKLKGRSHWYPYYAAFHEAFVGDVLAKLGPGDGLLLDPWNGSGTTTAVARQLGIRASGFDLNPALVVIAKGRLLGKDVAPSIAPLAHDILSHAQSLTSGQAEAHPDPLATWFDEATTSRLRALEIAIRHVLVGSPSDDAATGDRALLPLSPLAAFFLVALFVVVRDLTAGSRSSNPTWVRRDADRLSIHWDAVSVQFTAQVDALRDRLTEAPIVGREVPEIRVGDSRALPLANGSVAAILTSPPYATRIDYVVATRTELAVLGFDAATLEPGLRRSMLGSPLTDPDAKLSPNLKDISPSAEAFLDIVRHHPSKASSTYYARYFAQYFAGVADSLRELSRVALPAAPMAFVVQDSYYKAHRLDLAGVLGEVLSYHGRSRLETWSFAARSRAAINPRAREYRESFNATETLLIARR
jgi:DNA methylase.